jgi:hypothetical protein
MFLPHHFAGQTRSSAAASIDAGHRCERLPRETSAVDATRWGLRRTGRPIPSSVGATATSCHPAELPSVRWAAATATGIWLPTATASQRLIRATLPSRRRWRRPPISSWTRPLLILVRYLIKFIPILEKSSYTLLKLESWLERTALSLASVGDLRVIYRSTTLFSPMADNVTVNVKFSLLGVHLKRKLIEERILLLVVGHVLGAVLLDELLQALPGVDLRVILVVLGGRLALLQFDVVVHIAVGNLGRREKRTKVTPAHTCPSHAMRRPLLPLPCGLWRVFGHP